MRTLRQRGGALALGLVVLLTAGHAAAWPVDVRMVLAERETKVVELSSLDWVESDDPRVVIARRLPTGALELSAQREGQALVLLYAEGSFAVWRVVVGGFDQVPAPAPALRQAASEACPGLTVGPAKGAGRANLLRLQTTVPDDACRRALLPLLMTDAFPARELSLTFSAEALQAQLKELQGALSQEKFPVRANYVGAGLVLTGALSGPEHRQALWIAFHHSVGKVAFEDRVQVAPVAETAQDRDGAEDVVEVVPLETVLEEQRQQRKAKKAQQSKPQDPARPRPSRSLPPPARPR